MTVSKNGCLDALPEDENAASNDGNRLGFLPSSLQGQHSNGGPPCDVKLSVCFEPIVKQVECAEGTLGFRIATKNLINSSTVEVLRSFKDFIWLDYHIRTYHHDEHRIFPPLPHASGPKKNSNQNWVSSKVIDECAIDCTVLTQYLTFLCRHPKFAVSDALKQFLTQQEKIVPPVDLCNNLAANRSYKLPSTMNVNDDYFIKECTYISNYEPALANCGSMVKKLVFKTTDFAEIWAATSVLLQGSPDRSVFNKYLTLFAEVAHDLQFRSISVRDSDEITLGVTFSFNTILINEEKKILDRWHCHINQVTNARNNLAKQQTGSQKHRESSTLLMQKESELQNVAEQCMCEIDHLKRERSRSLCIAINNFAENQLQIAKELQSCLQTTLLKLKES